MRYNNRLCYIGSLLSCACLNFSIVLSRVMVQFASFQVSGQRISMFLVQMITTIISKSSLQMLVHKQGPALGVMPVFTPLIPL